MESTTDVKVQVQAFETTTTGVRDAVDTLLDQLEALLPLVAAAKASIGEADFAVARLRRVEGAIGQGPLNSVGAVQQSHKGLAAGLESFNQGILHLFDIRRELTQLHSSVLGAVQQADAATGAEPGASL